MHRLDIAQAIVGDKVLLKAEPKFRGKTFSRHPAMKDLNERVVSAYEATLQKMMREMKSYITKVVAPGAKLKKSDWMYGFASDVEWPEQPAEPLAAPMRPRAPLPPRGEYPRKHPQPLEGERPKPAEATTDKPKAMLHEPTAESSMYGFVSDVEWPDDHDLSAKIKHDDSTSPFLGDATWHRAMSIISPEQLNRLKQIIRNYHWAFAAQTLGPDVLPRGEVQKLIDAGVLPPDLAFVFHPAPGELPPRAMRFTDTAYAYGSYLGDAKQREAVRKMDLTDFATHAGDAPRPTSAVEKQAMSWARHNAGQYITGLGDRIAMEVGAAIMDEDASQRRRYLGIVREELEATIDRRKTWRQLASDLGHRTGDWSKGLQRIAATEKTWAMQEGTAREISKGREPDDVIVAKIPNPDACPDCNRLHLSGGKPRLFKMSELAENGTNVGKKRGEWKAVVGPVHPWCFPPGTPVRLEQGTLPIEDLVPGELVVTHANRLRAVQRLSSRHFSGKLLVLTAGHQTLKLTPEHPLLTARGWVLAGDVQRSDHLLQIHEALSSDPNPQDIPSDERAELFLASVLRALPGRGVPIGVNLHGNPQSRETDVGVEHSHRQLWDALVASVRQGLDDSSLVGTRRRIALSSLGRLQLLSQRARFSTNSGMGCLREALSIFRAAPLGNEDTLLREGADRDLLLDEPGGDRPAGGMETLRQLFDALSSIVQSDDFLDGQAESCGHDVTYHGAPVTSIQREPYDGLVYNFSVEEDESYVVANGFVAHNCGCELVEVPHGWGFDDDNNLVPEIMLKKAGLEPARYEPMAKAEAGATEQMRPHMTHGPFVPHDTVVVRVSDPRMRAVIENVVREAPPEIFHKDVGVTLITTDTSRAQNPLDEHDFAYWTGNEIRVMQTLPIERLPRVIRHELGHSLNVHLMKQLGSVDAVRRWHDDLWAISQREGWVSDYAKKLPIENAAEVTRMYIFEKPTLMLRHPSQFAFCRRAYKDIFAKKAV